ncbi:hypothetical protein [Novacetimonas hansenii]|uniref:hypothetical protein n=1 Tax=Novacetimonas hansenii TaxID=436 RepID=UPI00094F532D|nr:hypothetical protein [Novacetimonas hansenii]
MAAPRTAWSDDGPAANTPCGLKRCDPVRVSPPSCRQRVFATSTIECHENARMRGTGRHRPATAQYPWRGHYECDPAMPQISDAGPDA